MDIRLRTDGQCTTFDIRGRLDAVWAPVAEAAFHGAIESGASRLVLNLAGVDYISSAGLRVLLATAKRLTRQDGKLVLCELQSGVREVFAISGLSTVFCLAASETAAQSLVTA